MTKEVLVSVSGTQHDIDEEDSISTLTRGEYYLKNDNHYILYEEAAGEGSDTLVFKCTIKISKDRIDITRRAASDGHTFTNSMVFEVGKPHSTMYVTPYGKVETVFDTQSLELDISENEMSVKVFYTLLMNGEHVSRCTTLIKITSAG